jgi:hypothetical protein
MNDPSSALISVHPFADFIKSEFKWTDVNNIAFDGFAYFNPVSNLKRPPPKNKKPAGQTLDKVLQSNSKTGAYKTQNVDNRFSGLHPYPGQDKNKQYYVKISNGLAPAVSGLRAVRVFPDDSSNKSFQKPQNDNGNDREKHSSLPLRIQTANGLYPGTGSVYIVHD